VPPVELEITEYIQTKKTCNCNLGKFPDFAIASIQYGPRLQSIVIDLIIEHKLSYQRVCTITRNLFSANLSEATIENFLERAYEKAKRVYTWTWQNKYASYFVRGLGRGFNVIEKYFLAEFNGSYLHDDYSSQNKVKALMHQHCHPHITRKL
jgi:NADPH-dependent 7-cyano-7-deazaguanine reductase QueF